MNKLNGCRHFLGLCLAAIVAFTLCGCSSVMHPPSASSFMASYHKANTVKRLELQLYGGNLDNDFEKLDEKNKVKDEHSESVFDPSMSWLWNKGNFTYGLGMHWLTPFGQLGFVSPHFGATAWASIYSPANLGLYYSDNFLKEVSGGVMLVEQLPIKENINLGFTQHFSRNGIERTVDDKSKGFWSFAEPHPLYYLEFGGGLFVSYKYDESYFAFEFRYGRDIDNDANRFAVLFDIAIP